LESVNIPNAEDEKPKIHMWNCHDVTDVDIKVIKQKRQQLC